MSDIESFEEVEEAPCGPHHCLDHTGYVQAIKNIDGKISGKLNVLISVVVVMITSVISFGAYLVIQTSSLSKDITLIQERQRTVLEWKTETDRRMDVYERYLNKQP